jgi:hypothetical protein
MTDSASFLTLIRQYQTLCQYCDAVFAETFQAFQTQMQCAKGCASCCILETVAPLEAYLIRSYLQSKGSMLLTPPSDQSDQTQKQCAFLQQNMCTIYPVRPIICRTHGLPLIYPDRSGIDVCPLNFTTLDLRSVDPRFLLDADRLTQNLMRLNLAFSILTHQPDIAGERIPLQQLLRDAFQASGNSPFPS